MNDWTMGHTVHYYQQVESTMPVAHSLVEQWDALRTVSGSVVVAEEQLAGRGRRQRRWETPHGTALLTGFVLCAPHLPANMALLPMISGLATVRAIAEAAPSLRSRLALKWPNDVLIHDDSGSESLTQQTPVHGDAPFEAAQHGPVQIQKVAGVLVEAAFENERPTHAVLGIGINVNQTKMQLPSLPAGALPPTSLRVALGQPVDRTELLIALCAQLSTYVNRLSQTSSEQGTDPAHEAQLVHHEWRSLLHTLGRQVAAHPTTELGEPITGTAVDVTEDGSLLIVDASGVRHTVAAGDVSLRNSI